MCVIFVHDTAILNLHIFCKHVQRRTFIMANNKRGARGVMVIVAGIGHGDTSSNPGLIAFHIALIPLGTPLLSHHVDRKFFYKKWTQKISISLAQYRLAKSITSIFIELFLAEVFCIC